jgi:cysteine synthase B
MPAEGLEDLSEWGVPFSNGHRVLFVCPIGEQSRKFAAFFKARGIKCASLKGGFIAWRDGGKPIERTILQASATSSVNKSIDPSKLQSPLQSKKKRSTKK